MADELTRKLDYLHVTNEGLTNIQILNIQLQVPWTIQQLIP